MPSQITDCMVYIACLALTEIVSYKGGDQKSVIWPQGAEKQLSKVNVVVVVVVGGCREKRP